MVEQLRGTTHPNGGKATPRPWDGEATPLQQAPDTVATILDETLPT